METLVRINQRILNFFENIFSFIRKISNKKWFIPVLLLVILFITTIFFFLMNLSYPDGSQILLYDKAGLNSDTGITYEAGDIIYDKYWQFISIFRYDALNITILILLIIPTIIFIYLLANRHMTQTRVIVYLCIIAFIIRLGYMSYCDALVRNQHDVFSSNQYGHAGITFHIFYTGRCPNLITKSVYTLKPLSLEDSFDRSYQLYHTKMSYYIYAGWMRFISLFVGDNQYLTYQSIKIISTWMSMTMLIVSYFIMKELKIKNIAKTIAMGLLVIAPTFIILCANSNNDTCLYFFIWLAIYFAIRYYNNKKLWEIIALAASIGMAMGSKISGALVAVPIGVLLIIMIVQYIKNKEVKKMLLHLGLFAVVVFPIGLFWTAYNSLVYHYPFMYMWSVTNPGLQIDADKTFWDRFFFVDLKQLFNTPFVHLGKPEQDYSTIIFLLKSALFGEWTFSNQIAPFCMFMLVTELIIVLAVAIGTIYLIIRHAVKKDLKWIVFYLSAIFMFYGVVFIFNKAQIYISIILLTLSVIGFIYSIFFLEKRVRNWKFLLITLLSGVFIASYISFNIKEPFVCTQDFRYIVPIMLTFAIYSGVLFTKIFDKQEIKA